MNIDSRLVYFFKEKEQQGQLDLIISELGKSERKDLRKACLGDQKVKIEEVLGKLNEAAGAVKTQGSLNKVARVSSEKTYNLCLSVIGNITQINLKKEPPHRIPVLRLSDPEKLVLLQRALNIQVVSLPNENDLEMMPNKEQREEFKEKLKEMWKQKQEFMVQAADLSTISKLLLQNRRYPIMGEGVAKLAESYEDWEGLQSEELAFRKKKIQIQHDNLAKLVQEFASFDHEQSMLLSQMNALNSPELFARMIPFFQGEILKDEDLSAIKEQVEQQLENFKEEPKTLEELKTLRERSPIKKRAIHSEANVFEAERAGKEWARTQTLVMVYEENLRQWDERRIAAEQAGIEFDEIEPPKIQNKVFKLRNIDDREMAVAYFKGSHEAEEVGAELIEKLMWDIAVFFGKEELFTATKTTTFQSTEGKKYSGTIQPAIPGVLYWDLGPYEEDTVEGLVPSVVAAYILGMADVNGGNLIINPNTSKAHFFDNARSLMSSHQMIYWAGDLRSPFRMELLSSPRCLDNFFPVEMRELEKEVASYEEKMASFREALNQSQMRNTIKKLPNGAIDIDEVVEGMEERIKILKDLLTGNKRISAFDIFWKTSLGFRFLLAFRFASIDWFAEDEDQKIIEYISTLKKPYDRKTTLRLNEEISDLIRYSGGLTHLIQQCAAEGIDPKIIYGWISDPSSSLLDIMVAIAKELIRIAREDRIRGDLVKEEALYLTKKERIERYQDSINSVYQNILKIAKFDCKDIEAVHIPMHCRKWIVDNLPGGREGGVIDWFIKDEKYEFKNQSFAQKHPYLIFEFDKPAQLFYKDPEGKEKTLEIDYLSKPGKLRIEAEKSMFKTVQEILDRESRLY